MKRSLKTITILILAVFLCMPGSFVYADSITDVGNTINVGNSADQRGTEQVLSEAETAEDMAEADQSTESDESDVLDESIEAEEDLEAPSEESIESWQEAEPLDSTNTLTVEPTTESTEFLAPAEELIVQAEEDQELEILEASSNEELAAMYRLYNPNGGEHFYTASSNECSYLMSLGWKYEGVGWLAPKKSNKPVYRLYNPNGATDHHYTMSLAEKDYLVKVGWRYEGIGWYSDEKNTQPLYRQYNPNAKTGSHNYTSSLSENNYLVKVGWRAEGIGWYGCDATSAKGKATIKAAEEDLSADPQRTVYLGTTNGKRTLKNYLQNAMVPVGRTLYIWGGGWGSDRHKIGYLKSWETFFKNNKTANYDYKDHRYEYGNGLDCSGYVAWVLYNTMYSKNGINDLNLPWGSTVAAKRTIEKGFATDTTGQKFYPGDVVSMVDDGHVWISLGQYKDGSILLVHSSPKGVQISGTKGTAATRANYYMKKYFKAWPYATRTVGESYYKTIQKATWKTSGGVFTDPDGIQKMSAEQVTKLLFGE